MSQPIFDFKEDSTIHAAWAVPCGTGNLMAVIWEDVGGPVKARWRFENHGRKYVSDLPLKRSVDETITQTRELVSDYVKSVEQMVHILNPIYETPGRMSVGEFDGWIRCNGAFYLEVRKESS
jgi:hypothetical protein